MVLVFRQSFENRSKLMWACNTVPTHTFTNDGHKTGNFMSYSFSFVNRSLYFLDKTRTAAKCAKCAKSSKSEKSSCTGRATILFFSLSLCSFLTISSPLSGLGCYISVTGHFCSSTTETPSKNATNEKFDSSNEEK